MDAETIQCCLYFPGRGLKHDRVRLVDLRVPGWMKLRGLLAPDMDCPVLCRMLAQEFPVVIGRDELSILSGELDRLIRRLPTDVLAGNDELFTLSCFMDQACQQREASAILLQEGGPGYDRQTVLVTGIDVLGDLEAINAVEYPSKPDGKSGKDN